MMLACVGLWTLAAAQADGDASGDESPSAWPADSASATAAAGRDGLVDAVFAPLSDVDQLRLMVGAAIALETLALIIGIASLAFEAYVHWSLLKRGRGTFTDTLHDQ
jgi:hypothetical protein